MDAIRIGVVGDYQDGNETHLALGPAADHAAERAGSRATTTWIATPELDGAAEQVLGDFDALWIAPGSPYRSMRGALEAIAYARTSGVPLLGTCGGFQHLIIELSSPCQSLLASGIPIRTSIPPPASANSRARARRAGKLATAPPTPTAASRKGGQGERGDSQQDHAGALAARGRCRYWGYLNHAA